VGGVGRRTTTRPRRSRLPGWLRRRQNGLIALVAVLISGALVLSATNAAFTATTTNPGNAFAAGTVTLTDNDSGATMFSPSNLKPGESYSSCITVTYSGSLPSLVKLYGSTPGGTGLGAYVDLTITRGTISAGSFGDCTSFTPDSTDYLGDGAGVLYKDTLANFPTSIGSAVDDLHAASVPEAWTTSEAHAYKFTATLRDDNNAQGLTATNEDFTWQAVNTTAYSQVILSDSPASYWKLDETNGTTAADSTGAVNGTYANGTTLNQATGVKDAGAAVAFDGVDDSIDVGNNYNFGGNSNLSLEAWVKPTAANANYRRIFDKSDGYSGWYMDLDPAGSSVPNRLEFARLDGSGGAWSGDYVFSQAALQAGAWYHIVVTYDGSKLRMYVNGALQGSPVNSTRSIPTNSDNMNIGRDPWSDGFFVGSLDEAAAYNYALSPQQVLDHYGAGTR
jgi:hypothetical protein